VLRLYSIFQPPEDGLFAMPLTFYLSTTSLFQTSEPPVDAHEFAAVLLLRSANSARGNALISVSLMALTFVSYHKRKMRENT
jgi:hypothetical protein